MSSADKLVSMLSLLCLLGQYMFYVSFYCLLSGAWIGFVLSQQHYNNNNMLHRCMYVFQFRKKNMSKPKSDYLCIIKKN